MRLSNVFAAAASLSMTATPVLAAPVNPAAGLSTSHAARSASTTSNVSTLMGGGGGVIAIIALFVVVGGIFLAARNEDNPSSP